MQYCLAINSHGNEDNFCDAIDHIIGQSPKLFCTHLKALKNFFIRPADRIVDIGKWIAQKKNHKKFVYQFLFHFIFRFEAWNCFGLHGL